jgi:aspartyl-tRNA(Asn)/glutamyl-tRNA(Gln) amidotransferase subunit B
MRTKETAMDYRYFPEPDLTPLEIGDEWIARVKADLPELAEARKRRLVEQYALSDYDAGVLTSEKAVADLLEQAVEAGAPAKAAANWITGRLLYHINERGLDVEHLALTPSVLAELVQMVAAGAVSGPAARQVFDRIVGSGESPKAVVAELGLAQISAADEIAAVVAEVIAENPDAVDNFRKGKDAALKFLVGQVMRKSKGRANPQMAAEVLRKRIGVS